MPSSTPVCEIYAVKYAGPLISSVAMVLWNTDWEKKIERNYDIWVVRGNGETLIVDCGVAPSLTKERQIKAISSRLRFWQELEPKHHV